MMRPAKDTLVLNSDMSPITVFPLSTINWENAVKAIWIDAVSIVAEYDDWEVHSPSTTMAVPSIIMTKQHLHFQRTVAFTSDNIHLRDRYTCGYCMKVFPQGKLTLDHVTPRKYGGKNTWENLISACGPCNSKKGHDSKVRPNKAAYKPTYYELLAIRKEYPLVVPCSKWVDFLGWPEENLFVKGENGKKILLHNRLAA